MFRSLQKSFTDKSLNKFILGGLNSRFSDDDHSFGTNSGTTPSFSNRNGVFHSTTSQQGPDGKVHTQHHSGGKISITI